MNESFLFGFIAGVATNLVASLLVDADKIDTQKRALIISIVVFVVIAMIWRS
jgi:hypothetical protein